MRIRNADDAHAVASREYPDARALGFKLFKADDNTVAGWTFQVRRGSFHQFGWVLTDGRVSPALTDYRSEAVTYGQRTAAARN